MLKLLFALPNTKRRYKIKLLIQCFNNFQYIKETLHRNSTDLRHDMKYHLLIYGCAIFVMRKTHVFKARGNSILRL